MYIFRNVAYVRKFNSCDVYIFRNVAYVRKFNSCDVYIFRNVAYVRKFNSCDMYIFKNVCYAVYSQYEVLIIKAGKTTMLIIRLNVLCREIYHNKLCEDMKEKVAKSQSRSSLRFPKYLEVPRVNQVSYGTKNLRVLRPKIWSALPEHLKTSDSLEEFKRNFKLCDGPTFSCNFCKYSPI